MKLRQQVFMSANERFWSEIKRSDKQLLQRRLIFNDCLPKFNTENFVWSQFVLIGIDGPTRRKFFAYYIESTVILLEEIFINWTKRLKKGQVFKTYCGAGSVEDIKNTFSFESTKLIFWIGRRKEFQRLRSRVLAPPKTFPVNPQRKHEYVCTSN